MDLHSCFVGEINFHFGVICMWEFLQERKIIAIIFFLQMWQSLVKIVTEVFQP